MQIEDGHFDLPLFVVSCGNNLRVVENSMGTHLCLFTEELFAERLKQPGDSIRAIDSWPQLYGFIQAIEPVLYCGVCFDPQPTVDGGHSVFGFPWSVFKQALSAEAAK
jgi:hypothetical protein